LQDGNLEYIGRNDSQIKINGYLIEPTEIEFHILTYKTIKQAKIVVETSSAVGQHKYLVGYFTAETDLDEEDILTYLKSKLS
jgi:acyl-coenzyme A synthetase/AMP-(fatty) acid ligase